MRERRGQQGGGQAAVLLARRVDQPAGVAGVGRAGGVDEQAEQALGLGPALHGVLLVDLAGVLRHPPDPGVGLVAAADPPLDQRPQHDLGGLAALLARPAADDVDGRVERVGVAQRSHVGQRPQAQRGVLIALHRGEQEAALELAGAVEVQHRARPAPAGGCTRAPASAAQTCCSP